MKSIRALFGNTAFAILILVTWMVTVVWAADTAINARGGAGVVADADSVPIYDASATAGATVTFANVWTWITGKNVQIQPSEGAFANGDKTKLDGIETAADVTDAVNVDAAGAVMITDLTTTVGDPGSDTVPAAEQAVRELYNGSDTDQSGVVDTVQITTAGLVWSSSGGLLSTASLMRLSLTTSEPTDEAVGDLVFADISAWDPASVGGSDDYLAICTATGSPGTWVAVLTDAGSLVTASIILENAANPTNTTEGRIQWDSDDDHLIIGDGAAARVVAKPLICLPPMIIAEPDQAQAETDDWPLYHFPAEGYPGGFTIESIHIGSSATDTGTLDFREYTNNGTAWTNASQIESITLSGVFTEDDGTLADAAIAADSGVWVSFGGSASNIAFYQVQICGYINTID